MVGETGERFLNRVIKEIKRVFKNFKIRDKSITILANNCFGGTLYYAYRLKFNSPTINLQIAPMDFLKLCDKLEYYIRLELKEIINKEEVQNKFKNLGGGEISFPVGKLGDISIYFQHSSTFAEAKEDWDRRKKRIRYNKLYIVLMDTNCTQKELKKFLELNRKKKIFITKNKLFIPNKDVVYFDKKEDLNIVTALPFFTQKGTEKFDFVTWINN